MKKFLMVTPLQPVGVNADGTPFDQLRLCDYKPVGNQKLEYHKQTRFPLMHLINGYAEPGEEIRVIAITPKYEFCQVHLQQLRDELAELQAEKGFLCRGVEAVEVDFAGDVATQIEVFHQLLSYVEDDDILYGCLTYGIKPMPIAELMAIQYAYQPVYCHHGCDNPAFCSRIITLSPGSSFVKARGFAKKSGLEGDLLSSPFWTPPQSLTQSQF